MLVMKLYMDISSGASESGMIANANAVDADVTTAVSFAQLRMANAAADSAPALDRQSAFRDALESERWVALTVLSIADQLDTDEADRERTRMKAVEKKASAKGATLVPKVNTFVRTLRFKRELMRIASDSNYVACAIDPSSVMASNRMFIVGHNAHAFMHSGSFGIVRSPR
jgi:hypothetical protein